MKFLVLYWPLILLAVVLAVAAVAVAIAHRRRSEDRRREMAVRNARYNDRSAQENVLALEQAAAILNDVIEAGQDPLVGLQLSSIVADAETLMAKLDERDIRPEKLPRRVDTTDYATRRSQSQQQQPRKATQ